MKKPIWPILAVFLIAWACVQTARADSNGGEIHRLTLRSDPDTARVIFDRDTQQLGESENACLAQQKQIIGSRVAPSIRVSYEIIVSTSRSLDDPKMLADPSVTGPFKGWVNYGHGEKTLHVPVIVLSDGTCVPYKTAQLELEIEPEPAVRTAKR